MLLVLAGACEPQYKIDHAPPSRAVVQPADEAAHPRAHTEWWYYVGHLVAEDGSRYGFELVLFKRNTAGDRILVRLLPDWWLRNLGLISHFTLSEYGARRFTFTQITNLRRRWTADDSVHARASTTYPNFSHANNNWLCRLARNWYDANCNLMPVFPPESTRQILCCSMRSNIRTWYIQTHQVRWGCGCYSLVCHLANVFAATAYSCERRASPNPMHGTFPFELPSSWKRSQQACSVLFSPCCPPDFPLQH
jgi:hypothetical protein